MVYVWRSRLGNKASRPPPACFRLPFPPCASGCGDIRSRGRAAYSSFPAILIMSPVKLPPTLSSRLSRCARSCSPSALAVSSASSISPSAIAPWSAFGASTACSKNGSGKYQRKQDLAHIKATWRVFQQISADTKYLDDIPRYWPQAQALDLPAIQYSARDV